MTFCKIHYVDVVPNPSAVMGRPVASKNLELIATSDGDLGDEWKEVAGCSEGVLSYFSTGMGTHRVEVPEACDAPGVRSTFVEIGEQLFDSSFRRAIGVDRFDGC